MKPFLSKEQQDLIASATAKDFPSVASRGFCMAVHARRQTKDHILREIDSLSVNSAKRNAS